jgi:hypothetical protein
MAMAATWGIALIVIIMGAVTEAMAVTAVAMVAVTVAVTGTSSCRRTAKQIRAGELIRPLLLFTVKLSSTISRRLFCALFPRCSASGFVDCSAVQVLVLPEVIVTYGKAS